MNKLFIDMDGVLTDFEKRYIELYDKSPKQSRKFKEFNPNWTDFVNNNNFANLEKFPGADDILNIANILSERGVTVEILSSSGGKKHHKTVKQQKLEWLKNNGINFKANIVAGRRLKSEYATHDAVLIDDTKDVIESFYDAGGLGILHTNSKITVNLLKFIFKKALNT